MGNPTGFLEIPRNMPGKRPVEERVQDYREVESLFDDRDAVRQAARCMDCGVPFCHSSGCPVANYIPVFNDLVYRGQWREAYAQLHATNNFPEITGRICPALCEAACTLSINQAPVTIRNIECKIAEYGFARDWMVPEPAAVKTGRQVAVTGSGPAGLAAAQQMARAGHDVVVFEKSDNIGGLLRYGIPDFKLDKSIIDRRLEQMRAEGVSFETDVEIGVDISITYLRKHYDAIVLAIGSGTPRDVPAEGRELEGIRFAVPFLAATNRRNAGGRPDENEYVSARGKNVLVIGGGDTGSDCVGTAVRHGAESVTQVEILPKPPEHSAPYNPAWPRWPNMLRTSSSHKEGCERLWSVLVKEYLGDSSGQVRRVKLARIKWSEPDANGRRNFNELPDSEFTLNADLVLIAAGFLHPKLGPIASDLGIGLDRRGNIATGGGGTTTVDNVFAAGDCARGASLVVHAIEAGRKTAAAVDAYLRGRR